MKILNFLARLSIFRAVELLKEAEPRVRGMERLALRASDLLDGLVPEVDKLHRDTQQFKNDLPKYRGQLVDEWVRLKVKGGMKL